MNDDLELALTSMHTSGSTGVAPSGTEWGYVTTTPKQKVQKWKPLPKRDPVPHYTPIPQDIHDKLVEALNQELEKARIRIMEQAQSESLTPDQIGDAMHRAYIAGIMWALENLVEIADRLGYPLPAKNQIDMNAIYKAFLQASPQSTNQPVTYTVTTVSAPQYSTMVGQH